MEKALIQHHPQTSALALLQPVWNSAIERHRAGDTDAAITLYQRYLKRNPQDAEAWLNLGAALRKNACNDAALVCYQRALRLRPVDAAVWSNLGNLWRELGQIQQSLRCHRRALELAPDSLVLRASHALALCESGELEQAERMLDECLVQEPGRADLRWERAQVRLHLRRYREAWPDYEARLQTGASRLPKLESARWNGERIGGKRLLLLAEQGAAETLWAARYLDALGRRGADLTLCAPAALHPLLDALPLRLALPDDARVLAERYDFHCPLMSLPGIVDARGATIPEPLAVTVPEASRQLMQQRMAPHADKMRIGIVWTARHAREGVPLARLLPLAAFPGVQLFSLQRGRAIDDIQAAGAAGLITELGSSCRHFGDCAAALESLDLLVSTDSEMAHLAGSLGKPVLGLLHYKPDWIYGISGDSTPWYPTLRLMRQQAPGEWDNVFQELLRLVGKWADIRCSRGR